MKPLYTAVVTARAAAMAAYAPPSRRSTCRSPRPSRSADRAAAEAEVVSLPLPRLNDPITVRWSR